MDMCIGYIVANEEKSDKRLRFRSNPNSTAVAPGMKRCLSKSIMLKTERHGCFYTVVEK